jgi:hypothetical protein
MYQMNDEEWEAVHSLIENAKAEVESERAFRKVYAAAGLLVFLYGVVYGSWMCPK